MVYKLNDNIKDRTPLMKAAFSGDMAQVTALLEEGADVNASDFDGDTALMFAAFSGHLLVVNELLMYGANVHAEAKNGWTAIRAARSRQHHQLVNVLEQASDETINEVVSHMLK